MNVAITAMIPAVGTPTRSGQMLSANDAAKPVSANTATASTHMPTCHELPEVSNIPRVSAAAEASVFHPVILSENALGFAFAYALSSSRSSVPVVLTCRKRISTSVASTAPRLAVRSSLRCSS